MAERKRIYKLVGFVRVEPENQEPMTLDEAKKEQEHCEAMQPENIYRIEPEPPSSVITIDVRQFIQDNFSEDDGYLPTTGNEIEQFKDQLEDDLSDWIKGEFSMFTPEPSAAEYARKERRDMGITE